jgi:Tfp pilus assembly protein PilF
MTEQLHLAYQHFQGRNLDQARRAIEQAITMDAGSLPGWELFSFIAEAQSEPAVASAALRRLLCLAPNNPTGWFRLGAIVASESKGVGAGQYFRQLAVMQPDNAVAWANAASFMLREGAVS